MTEEEKNYILDTMRQMYDSGMQAQTQMNGYILSELKDMKSSMIINIENAVQKSVDISINGKLKGLKTQLDNQDAAQAEFKKEVSPMLKVFKDKEIVKVTLTEDGKTIVMYAGWILVLAAVWTLFKDWIIHFIKS